jgi:hypothetical protein
MNSRQAAALQMEENPLQKAFENYQERERQWHEARIEADSLRATNSALLSEIGMLRESFRTADAERVRWQATASTLLGRLYAINDTISGAVRAAARDGLEARKPEDQPKPPEQAPPEPAAAAQSAAPVEAPQVPPETQALPVPPQRSGTPMPKVDFGGPRSPGGRP